MKDLQPYASDFDKWIYSLLEMLRTKYFDVSVNRRKDIYVFFYRMNYGQWLMNGGLKNGLSLKHIQIYKTTLDEHFQNKTTPQQILDLL